MPDPEIRTYPSRQHVEIDLTFSEDIDISFREYPSRWGKKVTISIEADSVAECGYQLGLFYKELEKAITAIMEAQDGNS